MRIEWLDSDYRHARVTRGWIRKRTAVVYQHAVGGWWRYENGDELPVGYLDWRLDRAQAKGRSPWKPVRALPEARVVK